LQKRGKNAKEWEKNCKILATATAAGENYTLMLLLFYLLLFLIVVVSVEKFH